MNNFISAYFERSLLILELQGNLNAYLYRINFQCSLYFRPNIKQFKFFQVHFQMHQSVRRIRNSLKA